MHSSCSAALAAAFIATLAGPLAAQQHPRRIALPPGQRTNAVAKTGVDALVTTDMTALTLPQLVQSLLGPGVVASNIVLHGAPIAAGTFQSGLPIIGIDSGIMLSSGNIASVLGPNASDSTSTSNQMPGDAQLDALTTAPTFDACSLEFDFTCPSASQITFQYVFSSEEYNEFVGTQYNDVFAFFLNGVNIATLPGGISVAINNVNCGNPYNSAAGGNCGLYLNNSCVDLPGGTFPCQGAYDTEMDGLTVVLTATGTLLPGTNHIKLAIADAGDDVYDSNVFIRGQSFTCGGGGAYFLPPTPCGQTLPALVGMPVQFNVAASAATGLPCNAVTLACGALPPGAANTPPLPQQQAGQNVQVATSFAWTPTAQQVGPWLIVYTATDQLSQITTCTIHVNVVPAASGNASSVNVGTGCVGSGQYPELRCDPPVLGSTVDIEITHGLPLWLTLMLYNLGPPTPTVMWPGCHAYVDLNQAALMYLAVTDALGVQHTPLPIPNVPALIGLDLTLQGVFLGTSDPRGVRASNGMYIVLGT